MQVTFGFLSLYTATPPREDYVYVPVHTNCGVLSVFSLLKSVDRGIKHSTGT